MCLNSKKTQGLTCRPPNSLIVPPLPFLPEGSGYQHAVCNTPEKCTVNRFDRPSFLGDVGTASLEIIA